MLGGPLPRRSHKIAVFGGGQVTGGTATRSERRTWIFSERLPRITVNTTVSPGLWAATAAVRSAALCSGIPSIATIASGIPVAVVVGNRSGVVAGDAGVVFGVEPLLVVFGVVFLADVAGVVFAVFAGVVFVVLSTVPWSPTPGIGAESALP